MFAGFGVDGKAGNDGGVSVRRQGSNGGGNEDSLLNGVVLVLLVPWLVAISTLLDRGFHYISRRSHYYLR